MTTALALLTRPVIISSGERSIYRLADESAEAFSDALNAAFELIHELPHLRQELAEALSSERSLYCLRGHLRLFFSPYHGFALSSVKASEEFKAIVHEANKDLISAKWQC